MAARLKKARPADLTADEALAEAYIAARKHQARWDDPKFARPPGVPHRLWLWVQTVGTLKDKFKLLLDQSRKFAQCPDQAVGSGTVDVAAAAVLRADLREAMEYLPKRHRVLIDAMYFGGMTQAGVAEKMKISQPAVCKMLQRAFAVLRDKLGDDYGEQ